jgi:hypothetical protein
MLVMRSFVACSLVTALLATACRGDRPAGTGSTPSGQAAAGKRERGEAAPAKVADVLVQGQTELPVKVGTTLVRTVTQSRAIPPEHQFEWSPEPRVEGAALRFLEVRTEPPPPDVDGGSTKLHYRFVAVTPGRAGVTIERQNPGPQAPTEPDRFTVVVSQ